jgi:hypothetical protein
MYEQLDRNRSLDGESFRKVYDTTFGITQASLPSGVR